MRKYRDNFIVSKSVDFIAALDLITGMERNRQHEIVIATFALIAFNPVHPLQSCLFHFGLYAETADQTTANHFAAPAMTHMTVIEADRISGQKPANQEDDQSRMSRAKQKKGMSDILRIVAIKGSSC